jgi:hypothetical protein
VNANVLRYLQQDDPVVCGHIVNHLNDSDCARYYPDALSRYYMVSQAYRDGVGCLGKIKTATESEILSSRKSDGSFGNALETALAVNTLLNLDTQEKIAAEGAKALMGMQKKNGSWERADFFSDGGEYRYGSDEVSTAIAVEALDSFSKNQTFLPAFLKR